MSKPPRSVPALALGLTYSLGAVALLLQALDVLEVRWSVVVPGILLLCGLVVLLSGIRDRGPR